jgi:hypothetical protein
MRKTTQPALEIAKLFSRFRRIMTAAQKAKVRVLLCGDIPDPRPAVDSKLKLLDEALKDLEMGEGNLFLNLRSSMLDAEGHVRTDIFKPRRDIHLNASGTAIASLRIQQMLKIMLPNLVTVQAPATVQTPAPVQAPAPAKPQRTRVQAPVQDEVPAPVVVNMPSVVNATLVAAVANAPAGVQQLVGQVQDLVIQHVAVVETPMEVEDEDTILERLFFKKYGRALPEKESDVDQIKFVIDLTDDTDEMEVATPVVIVKTEPIEVAEINSDSNASATAKVIADRKERRELVKARKALISFGKTLRKSVKIPEKEVSADSNVSVDTSVNPVESVTVNTVKTAEQAEMDAEEKEFAAEFGDVPLDEFDGTGSEFRLYGPEDVLPSDDEDAMINDV